MSKAENFYNAGDIARIEGSGTFEEMVDIAYKILDRMPADVGMVCGPITSGGLGSVEANIAEFGRRITALQENGKVIFDQMPFEADMQRIKKTPYYDPTRDHLLETFYIPIFNHPKIKTFYFIPGWEASYGARWERNLVTKLGKVIVDLTNY
jgi:hypothetical protein